MKYTISVSEPWFTLIKLGIKTCEGRLNKGLFEKLKKNDIIIFTNNNFGFYRKCSVKITNTTSYKTFKKYLKKEKLKKCLPGITKISNGEKVYHKYYTKEQESKFGIVAIKFELQLTNNKTS
jgi:ASC-1-like (ASCH) protein